jgi:hypothetical protein
MTNIPTLRGDVVVFRTTKTFRTFGVSVIVKHGQQDIGLNPSFHTPDHHAAIAKAVSLRRRGARIFFCDIDIHRWSELKLPAVDVTERRSA